jgi:hypothetical protein
MSHPTRSHNDDKKLGAPSLHDHHSLYDKHPRIVHIGRKTCNCDETLASYTSFSMAMAIAMAMAMTPIEKRERTWMMPANNSVQQSDGCGCVIKI